MEDIAENFVVNDMKTNRHYMMDIMNSQWTDGEYTDG